MQVRIVSCRSFKPSKTLFHSRERDWTFGDDQLCAQLCSENHCKRPIDFGDRFEQLSPFLSFMSLSATLGRRYSSPFERMLNSYKKLADINPCLCLLSFLDSWTSKNVRHASSNSSRSATLRWLSEGFFLERVRRRAVYVLSFTLSRKQNITNVDLK